MRVTFLSFLTKEHKLKCATQQKSIKQQKLVTIINYYR